MPSGDLLFALHPWTGEPPASNYATLDTRNGHQVLDFDGGTAESMNFRGVIPNSYGGGGLTVDIYWMATSATSGDVIWGVSIERLNTNNHDLDSDNFASEKTATTTTNATSGKVNKTTITFDSGAEMDSAAAGEPIRIRLQRRAADGGDTMNATDAELLLIVVQET